MRYQLGLMAAVPVVAVLLLEAGLSHFTGLGDPPLFQADAKVGYLMAPNQEVYRLGNRIAINGFHQRSEEISVQPAPGIERILFLGDSITFGIAALDQTQTFPERVASLLRESGRPSESINASAVSWGLGNERAYVECFGTFGSQIAILQVGSADLLQPASTGEKVGVSPAHPDRKPASAITEAMQRVALPRLTSMLGLVTDSTDEPVTREVRKAQFARNMTHFARLVALVQEQGTTPIVLLVPGLPELTTENRLTRYSPYRERFRTLVEELSIPLIDLSEEWEGNSDIQGYYVDGTHLTAEGNLVVAARIFQALDNLRGNARVKTVHAANAKVQPISAAADRECG
ncbi:SGNH/GDSL hydrolase family protein [Chelativorans sp. YIM 93263]|uniref:SGNH/GDSL hydrolase family protein n=1 Tax=Chelativorans sp. YIM 93263 TaxID=2906648 RepID=UPI002378A0B1|nr:SGNH/GDSL hydrolase family protein [Chelativorans sp. YIM 93263]